MANHQPPQPTISSRAVEASTGPRTRAAPNRTVLFVAHAADDSLRKLVDEHRWNMPVIACERDFLDPAIMAFGVTELPSLILIGPDGTALARNPSPRRLGEALQKLR